MDYQATAGGLTAGIKPSDIESTPSKPQAEMRQGNHYDTLESIRSGVSHVTEYDMTDDVFLPEMKKPLGISSPEKFNPTPARIPSTGLPMTVLTEEFVLSILLVIGKSTPVS